MLKLLTSKRMYKFQPHFSYVATLPEKALPQKTNDSVCCLPMKSVSGFEKSRLDHDSNQQSL